MSVDQEAWTEAVYGNNDGLLRALVAKEDPGVCLIQLNAGVNGLYSRADLMPWVAAPGDLRAQIARLTPLVAEVRSKLSGSEQRKVDLALLRLVRCSSCLSAVLGAGVSKAAGVPEWAELVERLLQLAMDNGRQIVTFVRAPDESMDAPAATPSADIAGFLGTGSYKRTDVGTERLSRDDELKARELITKIRTGDADTNDLTRGAQFCADLWGQELFAHLRGILYGGSRRPGPVHEAIAELADAQFMPIRGLQPGWWRIVSYNFDDLMGEALDARRIPRAAYTMRGSRIAGDPNALAVRDPTAHVQILHLHGYTPRRPFLITHIRYVFSTAQYKTAYGGERVGILKQVFEESLANPIHLALYVGCSFSDPHMNDLLREAAEMLPGRRHFALLQWPEKNSDPLKANVSKRAQHEARYHSMGIQPVWFKEFPEIPPLIRSLA